MGGEKVLLQILLFSIPCIFLFIKVTHIKKPVRDILLIAILVLISFLISNFGYLFEYLPNKSDYIPAHAIITQKHHTRKGILSRGSISVEFEGEKVRADSVTINCYENVGDSIVVGLKINNGKIMSAVRTELSITSRNLAWLTFLFWAIVLCLKQPKNK